MNQPNDCPRYIAEVTHERIVGELEHRVWGLEASKLIAANAYQDWKKEMQAELAESNKARDAYCEAVEAGVCNLAQMTGQRDNLLSEVKALARVVNTLKTCTVSVRADPDQSQLEELRRQRDAYRETAERVTKERDEFEKAHGASCKEGIRLAYVIRQVRDALRNGGVA
jgi:hypothetical protein